ncbi:MAG TPA: Stk1 family PASTA domain-containing Ser/Thr kinase [Micromonosporaceae bacterium]
MTAQARLLGGRYQVGELLGYGGMAEVHRGRDLRLGRDVAIKMLRTDLARDQTFQMRFRREAQNAAALNHPAIVAVYDTGEERGPTGETLPYIVMEFVNGRTLKEVLAVEGRLLPRRALEITADICAALEFSHRHGIIHRDVKPGNVMLTQTGQVKVMDFGIARALASGAATMTQTSAVIGTAQYLSPEQARGEPVDARSDVYATGCLLYELLAGHPPFVGDNPVSVAYQHVREDPRPPSEANPDVTPDVDAVVLKALAKNPINRYQSAAEMRADAMRAAAGRPVYATPVLREDATAATMPVPGAMVGPHNGGSMARVGNAQRRRNSTWLLALLSVLGVLAVIALATGLYLANRKPATPVPNLVGMTADDAARALTDAKLNGDPKTEPASGCTKNTVIDQDPKVGLKVDEGTTVHYTICGGPNMVKVPVLVNLTQEQAQTQLANAHLQGKFQAVDSDKQKGTVVKSDPPEGTSVQENATVTVFVSKGNEVSVPDLTGLTPDQAAGKLRNAGFTNDPKVIPRLTNDPNDDGKVTGQDPSAGTVKKTDFTVTIFVGKYQEPSPTPSNPSPTTSPTQSGG